MESKLFENPDRIFIVKTDFFQNKTYWKDGVTISYLPDIMQKRKEMNADMSLKYVKLGIADTGDVIYLKCIYGVGNEIITCTREGNSKS